MSWAGQRTTTDERADDRAVLVASPAAAPSVEAAPDETAAEAGAPHRPFWRSSAGPDRLRQVHRADRVLLAAIAVAAGLRLWGFAAQSLWYDEWLTAEAASGSLGHLRRYVTEQAGIPPTYFSFMWVWARVFGSGDAALRLPSVLAGIALVPVAYAAVRDLVGPRRAAARIAAVLVAVNPMLVWYSQEARPYSLLALLGTLSLLLLARARRSGRGRDLAWWSFVAALAIAVHYVAVFLVAVEVVVLLRSSHGRRRPARKDLLIGAVPAAVVLAALAPFGLQQFSERGNHSWITEFPLRDRVSDSAQGVLIGPSPPDHRLWMPVALAVVVALALLVARGDRGERRAALVAGAFGLVPAGLVTVAAVAGVDMLVARYLIVVLAAAIGAVAIGLSVARVPRAFGLGAVALVAVASVVTVAADAREPALQRSGWEDVAGAHEAGATADPGAGGERLLVVDVHGFLGQPLLRYLDGERILGLGVAREQVTVRQIDVVVAKPTDRPCNLFVGLACALIFLGAPLPEPLAGRLELDERIDLDQFVLERYTAAEPITVTPADVLRAPNLADSLILVTP